MSNRRSNRRGLAALGVFFAWAALMMAAGYAVYAGLERVGSMSGYAILSGTARIEGCESSWYGAPYTCEATVTWTDPVVRDSTWTEHTTVSSRTELSGDVAVERRTNKDRKASEKYGVVYTADYPVYGYTTLTVVALIAAIVVSLLIVPRKIIKRFLPDRAAPAPRDENAPAPGAVPLGADGRPLKRRRKRR